MAIKAGQILTIGKQFLIDRIQTAGPGSLTIPEEKVYELGNYKTVGITRDRPDLSFDLESLDMSMEIEAILTNQDPTAIVDGDEFNLSDAKPIDIVSPFKGQGGSFDTVRGVAIPFLTLESASYRFGLRANASESFTLRGDAIYYVPGTPYYAEYTVAATPAGPYTFTNTAIPTVELGEDVYALGVSIKRVDGSYERLFAGADYTDTVTAVTLSAEGALKVVAGDKLCVVYGSLISSTVPQSTHPLASVKPAAARGRDIDVYVGPQNGTLIRWAGVQSAEANWRVTLDADEEFGNVHAVSQDYDAPDVSGNIVIRANTVEYLFDRIKQVTATGTNIIANAGGRVPLEIEIRVSDPVSGDVIKTLFVPDAIIQPPAIQGRVQTKLETTFPWTSETGDLVIVRGERT